MTLTEMLNNEGQHYESMDEGAVVYIDEVKRVLKKWLKDVGLTEYQSFDRDDIQFSATESIRKLLIILVDEP